MKVKIYYNQKSINSDITYINSSILIECENKIDAINQLLYYYTLNDNFILLKINKIKIVK